MELRRCAIETQAVHAGERAPRPDFTPVSAPVQRSVGYLYESMDDLDAIFANARPGYVYARYGNPTVSALEEAVAVLEGGEAAVATASGMAAVHLVLLGAGLRPGEAIVAARDLYGASYALLAGPMRELGARVTFVDVTDLDSTRAAIEAHRPRLVFVETLSNPLLKLADIPALAEAAHGAGALLAVDSTFTSPYLLQPLAWGADYVVHSATKYLGGHGDVLGGVIISTGERIRQLRELLKLTGANLAPDAAWLVLRGLKTLPLRMRQQCENALQVACWLAEHPDVIRVHYPGLPQHPQHELARRLLRPGLYGAMVSFELAGGTRQVRRSMESLRLCLPATTLGDVYTLVLHPVMSSHRSVPPDERERMGIRDGLVRMSVGIEDAADIIADLEQALAASRSS